MPIPSPFHPRTSKLCASYLWKDWSGYYAVRSYDTYMEREYFAFRHTAGMIDVTPLYKCEVKGPDAPSFLARVIARDVRKLEVGQVAYSSWCDDAGKVVDDGTVTRLEDTYFRVTANNPPWAWLSRFTRGYDVTLEDSTHRLAALSIQGPNSRDILAEVSKAPIHGLKFFWATPSQLAGKDVLISRTGYTGDLGFEVWVDNQHALCVWDALMEAGKPYGLLPVGLDAMDMTRVEAGFILAGVDYYSAPYCLIESRKASPYELALGWTVHLDREPFIGQASLREVKAKGPPRAFVGVVSDWDAYEAHFERIGLPPEVHPGAWRDPVPVYNRNGDQVGQATSGAWSPLLKKNLALATVRAPYRKIGTDLLIEITVEYERHRIPARVTRKPFFDPERKKS